MALGTVAPLLEQPDRAGSLKLRVSIHPENPWAHRNWLMLCISLGPTDTMKWSFGSRGEKFEDPLLWKTADGYCTCVLGCTNATSSLLTTTRQGEGQLRLLTFTARKELEPNRGMVLRRSACEDMMMGWIIYSSGKMLLTQLLLDKSGQIIVWVYQLWTLSLVAALEKSHTNESHLGDFRTKRCHGSHLVRGESVDLLEVAGDKVVFWEVRLQLLP